MNFQIVMSSASIKVVIQEISCLAVRMDANVKIHTAVCKLSLSLFLVSMIMLLVDFLFTGNLASAYCEFRGVVKGYIVS